jgi:hypothetical protein
MTLYDMIAAGYAPEQVFTCPRTNPASGKCP